MVKFETSPSVDQAEIQKFAAMADEWWNSTGKFKPLHQFNPVRLKLIQDLIKKHYQCDSSEQPLAGLSLLDVGCGGGLVAEPMTRLGAAVTGIDVTEVNINIAKHHAQAMNLDIDYQYTSVEDLAASKQQFDVVIASEVVEHVADLESFMAASCQLVKPGGLLFVTTLNRTMKSFAQAIVGAEYILRWLPRGTHEWQKFLKPSELATFIEANGFSIETLKGLTYKPLVAEWCVTDDVSVNYLMMGRR